ncbi:MAG TPA: ATP-binding protein [Myxococcaceae bacterium]|jgi:signal transduction histidine kinase
MHMDERPWVVYVDDEPINLRVFEANFKDRFRLKTFQTAALALEFVMQHGPEIGVLITDQRMPEMTGVQLLEKVKHAAPDSQRMMLTAFADMQAMSDAVNLGQVTRYFGKPWSKEELAGALQDALTIFELTGQMRAVQARMVQSERLATLGQVSAGVAHELMNPVAYLLQNLNNLRSELADLAQKLAPVLRERPVEGVPETLEALPQLLDDLEQGAKHVSEVAQGIKNQARAQEPDSGATDLARAASFAVKIARAEVGRRARLASDSTPVQVRGTEVKLCQIILNLIINASHAMDGTGRPGLIEVRWSRQQDAVILQIIDNGSGIPPENLPRVFERFFTTKAPGVGTGLGLSICRELVESMGGAINLTSTVGRGTTVEIKLRLAD